MNRQDAKTPRRTRDLRSSIFTLQSRILASWRFRNRCEECAMTGTDGNRVAELERELAEERRARQALVDTSVRLNSLLNLPGLLNTIITSAADLLDAETGSLMLLDEATNELTFEVATGEAGQEVRELRVPADRGIAGWVMQHN